MSPSLRLNSFFIKRETEFEFYPLEKIRIEWDFPEHSNYMYSRGYSITRYLVSHTRTVFRTCKFHGKIPCTGYHLPNI